MPDCGPFGETFFDASVLAITDAFFLKSPGGGWVESVLTFATHFLLFLGRAMDSFAAYVLVEQRLPSKLATTRLRLVSREANNTLAPRGNTVMDVPGAYPKWIRL
jgi:hypothetical protein